MSGGLPRGSRDGERRAGPAGRGPRRCDEAVSDAARDGGGAGRRVAPGRPRRGAGARRPLGLRQVDPARDRCRPAGAVGRPGRRGRPSGVRRAACRLRPDAAARPAAAVALGARQRGARARAGRRRAARCPAPRPPSCSSASGSASSPPRARTSCPAACASGSRSRARCSPASPVLLLDEPFASLDAITRAELQEWLRAALADRAAHRPARHPRRRGGALPLRPRARALGPAGARADRAAGCPVEPPARAARRVTSPEFTALRARALEALA